jgi:hypothetical protein
MFLNRKLSGEGPIFLSVWKIPFFWKQNLIFLRIICIIRDLFCCIYMQRKDAEYFNWFSRSEVSENHSFWELEHKNGPTILSTNGHNVRHNSLYKLAFRSEVIKKCGYFYSLEYNRVSSSTSKFTSRRIRTSVCLNKISIVWGEVKERRKRTDSLGPYFAILSFNTSWGGVEEKRSES